jgi:bacterioferritin-associated ferredoxin
MFLYITSRTVHNRMICKFFTAVILQLRNFMSGNLECGKCIQNLSDTLRKPLVNAVEMIEFSKEIRN